MTIQEILNAIDILPKEDIAQIKQRIRQREQQSLTPEEMKKIWAQQEVQAEIQEIISRAKPIELQAGTMDVDALVEGFKMMRDGLTEEDLDEMILAMNEEYIEQLKDDEL